LELLLANPASRFRVAIERAGFLEFLLPLMTAIAPLALALIAPSVGLTKGRSLDYIVAATVATGLMSLVFATVGFAAGAATGNRSLAVSPASAVALAGFVVEGLGAQVKVLKPLREISPWHWLLHSEPLRSGWSPEASVLPVCVSLLLIALGALVFRPPRSA
jgi:ABC-2 type transport system permease protein